MRAVVQRVLRASVTMEGEQIGAVDGSACYLILLGIHRDDTEAEARLLARKLSALRIFADAAGKMNRSLLELDGQSLVISQFTLFADLRRGRRPSFFEAAPPEQAIPLIDLFCASLAGTVRQGRFGARMQVELVNDGPVTVTLDTELWRKDGGALTG